MRVNPCASTAFGSTNFAFEAGFFTQHGIIFTCSLPIDAVDAKLQFNIENFTDADPASVTVQNQL